MTYAAITGWGKCMPPSVLSNADLATILDTNDEWDHHPHGNPRASHIACIRNRDGARRRGARARLRGARRKRCGSRCLWQLLERRGGAELGVGPAVEARRGERRAMDVNTACTSFLYSLSTATAMIRTGVVRNAVVVGVELISPFMDWANRGVAVLFGDGAAAVVLQATDRREGVLAEKLGCYADARQVLRVRAWAPRTPTAACSWATRRGISTARNLQARRARNGERIAGCARQSRPRRR
jgi:3-oxoacyl-[acyl-carrier-protein] synthase-3